MRSAKESSRAPSKEPGIVGAPRENKRVTESPSAAAQRLLVQAAEALMQVMGSGSDAELLALLSTCENVVRRLDRATVNAVAVLERRGVFAERGYKSSAAALADLLGWERFEARPPGRGGPAGGGAGRGGGGAAGRARRGGVAGAVAGDRGGVRHRCGVVAACGGGRQSARHAVGGPV